MAALCSHLGTVDLVSHQEAFYSLSIQPPVKAGNYEINASLKFLLNAHAVSFAVQIDTNAFQLVFMNIFGFQGFQSIQNNEDQVPG